MCEPTTIMMGASLALAAVSTAASIDATNKQAKYEQGLLEHKNQVLETQKGLKTDEMRRRAAAVQSQAVAAGGSSGFMLQPGSTADQSGIDVAKEFGRSKYMLSLQTELDQASNIAAISASKFNAKSKKIATGLNFASSAFSTGAGAFGGGSTSTGVGQQTSPTGFTTDVFDSYGWSGDAFIK